MKKFIGIVLMVSLFSFANIKVDGTTNVYVEKSNNGVDVINISTPSPKGVSYSTFTDFNVSEKGAVINNAKNIARSRIAGLVNGNKNIKEERAKLALLNVTGINESKLSGILEALSKDKLDVILSNPNGITLDGASFLNIHKMSLVGASPILENGELKEYGIPSGDIKTLKELNTRENVEKLEIIANKFKAESDIDAKELLVKTYAGEDGTLLSAEIIGSVHGDVIKIVATKSGIGVKSINSKDLTLESKVQANIDSIKTENLNVKVEEDFNNKDKIVANNTITIEARNIKNDGNILLSDNIELRAQEKVTNINGGIIHADNNLKIKSKNLDNVGRVNSYGNFKVRYKDKNNKIIDNIDTWKKTLKETYVSYNAGILSRTNEAKNNALSSFYDEVVKIDKTEFDWRVLKEHEIILKNKGREGKKGIFFDLSDSEILQKDKIEEIKKLNKDAMYSQNSDNYLEESEKNILLKGYVENSDANTSFSVLSGNNVYIDTDDIVNNKDGHIIANKDNKIKANTYNNSSSISDEKVTVKDGYEKMIFDGSFKCPGGLVYCNILHNATYIRDLGNDREVNVKALPSHIKGENINISADNVNFKAYSEDESKKTLREEDERYVNNKEKIEINGKVLEYSVEDNPKYVKLSNFLNNPYFLNNIKYNSNNRYLIKEFAIQDKRNEEIEEEKPRKSNISINAKNLNIKDQKLLFDNIRLSSNNLVIEGANLKALEDLNIKSDNVLVKSIVDDNRTYLVSDKKEFLNEYESLKKSSFKGNNVKIDAKNTVFSGELSAKQDINISSDKLEIKGEKTTNKSLLTDNHASVLSNNENVDNTMINSKNLNIKSKDVIISSANIDVENNVDIDSQKLLITGEKTKDTNELRTASNKENEIYRNEKNNKTTINSKNINLNKTDAVIKGSDIKSDTLNAENLTVKSEILNNEYIKKSNNILYKEDTNIGYEENSSSNILVKDIKADTLNVDGSNIEADKLKVNKLNIQSRVINSKIKQKVETFNLVDGVNGNLDKDNLKVDGNISLFYHKIIKKDNSYNKNIKSNILVKEKADIENLDILSSNVELNNATIKNLNVKTQELNNKVRENKYYGKLDISGSVGAVDSNAGLGLKIQNKNIISDSKTHDNTNLLLKGKAVVNNEFDVTNVNLKYDELEINSNKANFRAIKDTIDSQENITGINLGTNLNVGSPVARDILTMGKAVGNVLEGRLDKAISNGANGYVGAVNNLAGNLTVDNRVATTKDFETGEVKSNISGYLNVGTDLSLNLSNKTILSHKEEVKGNTLSGKKLVFNNNKEVNYTSTVIQDSNVVYNNVENVKKDVLVAENKKETIDASVKIGVSAKVDTEKAKISLGNIDIGAKGSYEVKKDKINSLNELINSNEEYINVKNASLKGVISKNSSIKGNISNLNIEEVKDEKTVNKVGVGFDISISPTGVPTGGNAEVDLVAKRDENVYKNNLDLSNLKVDNLTLKEEKANKYNVDFSLKAGTSGVKGRIGDYGLDLNSNVINALKNPEAFKDKINVAKEELKSTGKAIKDKLSLIGTKTDELIDISERENRGYLEIKDKHIEAKYSKEVSLLNELSAKTKEERIALSEKLGLGLIVSELEKESDVVKDREKEVKDKLNGSITGFVGDDKNLHLLKDLSELEFKKLLIREVIINKQGKNVDNKLLGATFGEIYSSYITKGDKDKKKLEVDSNIPKVDKVISDSISSVNTLENIGTVSDTLDNRNKLKNIVLKKFNRNKKNYEMYDPTSVMYGQLKYKKDSEMDAPKNLLEFKTTMNSEEKKYFNEILKSEYKNRYLNHLQMKYNSGDTVTFKSINSKIPAIDLYSKIYSGQGLQVGRGLGATLEDAKFVNSNKNQQILYGLLDTIQGTSRIAGGATSLTAGAYMIPSGFGISYSGTLIAHGSSNLLFGANDTYRGISNIILGLKESSLGYNELAYIEATKERTQSYEFKKTALDKLEEKSSIIQGINLISLESTQYINEFIKLHFSKPKPTFINNNTLDNTDKEINIKPEVTISNKKDKNSKFNLVSEIDENINVKSKETIAKKKVENSKTNLVNEIDKNINIKSTEIIAKNKNGKTNLVNEIDENINIKPEKSIINKISENNKINLSEFRDKELEGYIYKNYFQEYDDFKANRVSENGRNFKNPGYKAGVFPGSVVDSVTGYLYDLSTFKGDVTADHIFPLSEIKKLDEYKLLSATDKKKVERYSKNIMYITASQNSSKNNKTVVKANDEKIYPGFTTFKGKPINKDAKNLIDNLQKKAKKDIKDYINELKNNSLTNNKK
ncbi:two-partner secretion domain-containing protein [Streptobacillus moniliformis]|uniref:two-partner secretion domain-containing protein n=2 Tax=Streptobacillus moniliformis TaxID=34105 RepID=UPI0007E360B7|nr:filamentous hemagglutinin N-terminal domain-containing protein [Streptobacillus moniliformis]